jgi:hypothetical protein
MALMLQIQTSRPLLVLEIREKLSRHAGERIVHFKARNSLRHPPELLTLPTSSLAAQINCLHLQSNYYSFTKGAESHCLLPVKYLCSRCQYTQSCAAGCAGFYYLGIAWRGVTGKLTSTEALVPPIHLDHALVFDKLSIYLT